MTKDIILVFGEDDHDRAAVRVLVEGLRPDLAETVAVLKRKQPLTLVKGMAAAKQKSRSAKVLAAIRAEAKRARIRACVFHEDTDATEPSHVALAQAIRQLYGPAEPLVVPAVAAWEIECWWFQFPEAVGAVRSTWRKPDDYVGRAAGQIQSPKERLAVCVRPRSMSSRANFRAYQPEDSEAVAKQVVGLGLVRKPKAKSDSYAAFVKSVDSIA